MKNMIKNAGIFMAAFGLGSLFYSYANSHPLKTRKALRNIENMMKDLM